MAVEQQYISADKFLDLMHLPEYVDRVVELVEGVIVDMPLPNPVHAAILVKLSSRITVFADERNIGETLAGDVPFVLKRSPHGRDTLRGVDIAFITRERMPKPMPNRPFEIAPDLAIEIVSPSNKAIDIENKTQQLLEAGTKLIWIVYPDLQSISVRTQDGANSLKESDNLSGGDVLPGLEIQVAEIFPD